MNKKAFTLLELLVVVLIIGILAAIALPQYKMAVAKSKFNTLKGMVKSLAESSQRYYLANGMYPQKIEDLDISFSGAQITYSDTLQFSFSTPEGFTCTLWTKNSNKDLCCGRKIFNKYVSFYIDKDTNKPRYCLAYSKDESNIANRLCQKETGMKNGYCSYEKYCAYSY